MATNSHQSRDDVPLITDVYPEQQPTSRIFPAKHIFGLSVALIVFGGCSILFNGAGLANGYTLLVTSPGIYCGAVFIAAGAIGIETAKKKSRGFTITLMIMAVISIAFAVVQLAVSLTSLVKDTTKCNGYWSPDCYNWPGLLTMTIVMDGLLVACAIVAMSLSIRLTVLSSQLAFRCCVNGDCDSSCCDVIQDTAIPIYYYGNTSTPNTYIDVGRDSQRQAEDNIRQLSQLPPAQLQHILAISQSTAWPPASQFHPHHHPPSYTAPPPSQGQGQGHQVTIADQ